MNIPPISQNFDRADKAAQKAVEQLEASFWAEMLRSSNAFDYGPDGGIGAEQFKSFMIDEQAQILARSHPLGLGKTIISALNIQGESHE